MTKIDFIHLFARTLHFVGVIISSFNGKKNTCFSTTWRRRCSSTHMFFFSTFHGGTIFEAGMICADLELLG